VSEIVPEAILALLKEEPYLSTACGTGRRIEAGPYSGHRYWGQELPDGVTPLLLEREISRLHNRCRMTHKFTGTDCICDCHGENAVGVMADCRVCRGHRVLPDRSKPLDHNGEPPAKPCPRCGEAP
jgi:hypothetical protein